MVIQNFNILNFLANGYHRIPPHLSQLSFKPNQALSAPFTSPFVVETKDAVEGTRPNRGAIHRSVETFHAANNSTGLLNKWRTDCNAILGRE
jgi:hypothetical protein